MELNRIPSFLRSSIGGMIVPKMLITRYEGAIEPSALARRFQSCKQCVRNQKGAVETL
jgi:hypothetical protein